MEVPAGATVNIFSAVQENDIPKAQHRRRRLKQVGTEPEELGSRVLEKTSHRSVEYRQCIPGECRRKYKLSGQHF